MPDSDIYKLLPKEGGWEIAREGVTLEQAHLSPTAFVVLVSLKGEDVHAIKRSLGLLLRTGRATLQQHGVDCPTVAVVFPSPSADGALSSDQEWHRGDFSVYECDRRDSALKLVEQLCAMDLPVVDEPYAPKRVVELKGSWDLSNPILRELADRHEVEGESGLRSWQAKIAPSYGEGLMSAAQGMIRGQND